MPLKKNVPSQTQHVANYRFKNVTDVATRVKQSVDLVKVMVDSGLHIPNTSQRTVKIKCFEHQENDASLGITKDKGLFHCYGCKVGGDVIAFVQQYHRLAWVDAVNFLIQTYDIDVEDLVAEATPEELERDRLFKLNRDAAVFLHSRLGKARQILSGKGISDDVLTRFMIGYSDNPITLVKHLRSSGATEQDIRILQLDRDDMFTNRIIYPIFSLHGQVTHFYGRAVGPATAKYIGTSYDRLDRSTNVHVPHPLIKLGVPYGLHAARSHVSRNGGALIAVEGHNDVLGLHSHGILNSMAMMTSAPSEKQYNLLSELNIHNLIVVPDGDTAGFKTVVEINKNRAVHQQIKIAMMPAGHDPDEFVRDNGAEAFMNLIAGAMHPIEFVIRDMAKKCDGGTMTAKLDAARETFGYIAPLSGFEREFAIGEISTLFGVDQSTIDEAVCALDEGPLSDVDLERKVIGECILDRAKTMHAMTILRHTDFTAQSHGTMWKTLANMVDAGIEPFTREMFITYAIDTGALLEKDASHVPTVSLGSTHSLDYAIKRLRDFAVRRHLAKSASKFMIEVKSNRADVTEVLHDHLHAIANASTGKHEVNRADDQITKAMDLIHERMHTPGIPGINIGPDWRKFMNVTMGFQKKHMITVAGVTKAGKTTIAQNWNLQQLIHVGEPTLWVNLEMGEQDLVLRNLSIMTGVDNQRLKAGNISREEKELIDESAAIYHGFKLHVANMAGASAQDVVNVMRKYVYTAGVKLVFIDYIQLLRSGGRGGRALWEDQMETIAAIRSAINELNVCGVVISQLNRTGMVDPSQSSGANVAGSIKLIQDSDMFMSLRRKKQSELDLNPTANCVLELEFNRHGPQGVAIDIDFRYNCGIIKEA